MTKAQRIKEIKDEIKWYKPKKKIADAMLELGEAGFEFSGHGVGLGGEDFNLKTPKFYVNFCDMGKKVIASIYGNDDNVEVKGIFEGTVGGALKYLKVK